MLNKLEKIVKKYPNKIAYKIDEEYITYQELWNKAQYYAEFLKRQDTSPVIIYGHKNINVIISIFACILANRTYIPLDIWTPLYRLKNIIEITNSSLILTDNTLKIENISCCSLNNLTKYAKYEIKENNNDIVYIIFTSGSTGIPKGVPISKTNLDNFINWISNLEPLSKYQNINVLNQASFSFDLSVADLYYSLCNGHTLVASTNIEENFNKIFTLMKDIDVAVMTPTFMKLCLLNAEFTSKNYPNFKCVYFCGELLEPKTVQKIFLAFPNLKIINAYGPTEATSAVSGIVITKEMANFSILPVGEIGKFATDIEIINNEIVLKGKSVFGGYLTDYKGGYYKEKNINCYKTGDIGYFKDNKLYCKGRMDNQIKYKGYRIELNEIEYYINLIKGVKDCAVIAKYNDNQIVKALKAFVLVDKNLSSEYIKEELKKYLPEYMIPKTIKIMDKLPINKNGKIDRKALKEL